MYFHTFPDGSHQTVSYCALLEFVSVTLASSCLCEVPTLDDSYLKFKGLRNQLDARFWRGFPGAKHLVSKAQNDKLSPVCVICSISYFWQDKFFTPDSTSVFQCIFIIWSNVFWRVRGHSKFLRLSHTIVIVKFTRGKHADLVNSGS